MWGCCPPIFRHGIPWGLESLSASIQLHTALQRGRGPEMGLMFFCTKGFKNGKSKNVCFSFTVEPWQICWLCEANKGASSMHLCFTDLSAAAAWRNTFCSSPPWETVPYYGSLVGFHIAMIFPDLLHVWNLGVARDAAGSILKKFYNNERFLMAAIWTNACNKQLFPLEPMHAVILTTFVWSAWPEISWIGEPKNILNWWHLAQTHTSYAIG